MTAVILSGVQTVEDWCISKALRHARWIGNVLQSGKVINEVFHAGIHDSMERFMLEYTIRWIVPCWNTRFDEVFHAGIHDSMKCFMLQYTIRGSVSCWNTRFYDVYHAGVQGLLRGWLSCRNFGSLLLQ